VVPKGVRECWKHRRHISPCRMMSFWRSLWGLFGPPAISSDGLRQIRFQAGTRTTFLRQERRELIRYIAGPLPQCYWHRAMSSDPLLARANLANNESYRLRQESRALRRYLRKQSDLLRTAMLECASARAEAAARRADRPRNGHIIAVLYLHCTRH